MALRCNLILLVLCWLVLSGHSAVLPGPIIRTIGTVDLNASLTAYWKLDEASGARADSGANGQTLTDNNTVTSAAGVINNAAAFVAANFEYLSRADNATLSPGDIDFTVAAWVYIDSTGANRNIMSKWQVTGNQREYLLRFNNSNTRFEFIVSPDGTASTIVIANTFGAPSLATWYLVIGWHDATNNLIGISINAGAADTGAHTTGVFDSTSDFNIGAAAGASPFDGRIDEAGFWKKLLTSSERTYLYNAGAGKTCCPF